VGVQIGLWDESLAPAYEKTLDLASECSASKYRDNPGYPIISQPGSARLSRRTVIRVTDLPQE